MFVLVTKINYEHDSVRVRGVTYYTGYGGGFDCSLVSGMGNRTRQSSLSVRNVVVPYAPVHEIRENVLGVKARGGVTATRMRVESFNF